MELNNKYNIGQTVYCIEEWQNGNGDRLKEIVCGEITSMSLYKYIDEYKICYELDNLETYDEDRVFENKELANKKLYELMEKDIKENKKTEVLL